MIALVGLLILMAWLPVMFLVSMGKKAGHFLEAVEKDDTVTVKESLMSDPSAIGYGSFLG